MGCVFIMNLGNTFAVSVLFLHFSISNHICKKKEKKKDKNRRQILYLNCWSLVLLVLARNLSANFSKFLE